MGCRFGSFKPALDFPMVLLGGDSIFGGGGGIFGGGILGGDIFGRSANMPLQRTPALQRMPFRFVCALNVLFCFICKSDPICALCAWRKWVAIGCMFCMLATHAYCLHTPAHISCRFVARQSLLWVPCPYRRVYGLDLCVALALILFILVQLCWWRWRPWHPWRSWRPWRRGRTWRPCRPCRC